MPLITSFDPWRSGLCTCPPKLTFNPYTGCDHQCIYCYATSYIQNFKEIRPKKELLAQLQREAAKLKGETISIANSSDPYPRAEASEGLTRRCLEILAQSNCKVQIITKSDLVARDDDLLAKIPSTVALTITTDDDSLAKILEPFAPPPSQRLRAAQDLIKAGIPVSVRIDPIIFSVNDLPLKLISELASIGVKHITPQLTRLKQTIGCVSAKPCHTSPRNLNHYIFRMAKGLAAACLCKKTSAIKILKSVRDMAEAEGMKFGFAEKA